MTRKPVPNSYGGSSTQGSRENGSGRAKSQNVTGRGDLSGPPSEGAQRLGRLGLTDDEIASVVGVSRAAVTQWRHGSKHPGSAKRRTLATAFGIPESSWSSPPVELVIPPRARSFAGAPSALPRLPKDAVGLAEVLQGMALDLVAFLRTDPRSSPPERARVMQSLAPTLAILQKITGGFEMTPAKILRTPAWKEIEAAFAAGLAGHPKAAKAVARALRELGAVTPAQTH